MRKNNIFHRHFSSVLHGSYRVALICLAIVFLVSSIGISHIVSGQSLEEQVQALQQENKNNKAAVKELIAAATSYQNAIDQLQAQINQLQAQINQNEAQKAALERQIREHEAELEKQRKVLGENIKAMYVSGEMTTIEMLATSKDLSEFVDKETYRNAVQSKIQETMAKIAKLQNELNEKKKQIEVLLASLQSQRAVIAASRAEQSNLLSMNQSQQAEFNNRTKDNQAKINDLNQRIAAQRAANSGGIVPDGGMYFIRFPGPVNSFNPGNYPHKNAGFSMQLGPCSFYDAYPDSPDGWGYCTRQCVSYAAWAVGASGRSIPMYYGNAKDWVSRAPASYVHRTPQVGDVAITTSGTWGHAMYVEAVDGNRIYVSQYNQQLTGEFSYQWRVWR
jgi:peptidoglycan hydrolase CwlO-like protein